MTRQVDEMLNPIDLVREDAVIMARYILSLAGGRDG